MHGRENPCIFVHVLTKFIYMLKYIYRVVLIGRGDGVSGKEG